MGFDVYGNNPDIEIGEYFRANIWWWHPLWDYCREVAPEIVQEVQHGHTNDGDGLNAYLATELAEILKDKIDSGEVEAAVDIYNERLRNMPEVSCIACDGTGKRLSPPLIGAGGTPCDSCDSIGRKRPFETWYHFDKKTVQEFADFLLHCGGFEIW